MIHYGRRSGQKLDLGKQGRTRSGRLNKMVTVESVDILMLMSKSSGRKKGELEG